MSVRFCMWILVISVILACLPLVPDAKAVQYDDYEAVQIGSEPESATEGRPDPDIICKLPMKRGNCRALLLRWRYDPSERRCVEFKYGGCAGNANNFATKRQCMNICKGV